MRKQIQHNPSLTKMATTKCPHTLGAPTSKYKIKCTPGSVIIGDREFLSATEALEAYLTQYDKQGLFSSQPLYKKTVTDLLDPKSALHMTAERSLETGVRATGTELRLADQKEKINESLRKMKKSVALKAEGNLDSNIATPHVFSLCIQTKFYWLEFCSLFV